ncbi:MAG: hypothetical protein AAGU27_08820 [Dehalobacterium sp.]
MSYKELLKELEVMEDNNFTTETLFVQTQRLVKKALTEFLTEKHHENMVFLDKTLINLAFAAAKYNMELVAFFDLIEMLERYKYRIEELSPEEIGKNVKRAKELVYALFNSKIVVLRPDKV